MLDSHSPPGLRVVQITTDPTRPSWNVYTEAPVFTSDSRRFVFIREGNYWLCDIGDNFALRQLTDERGAKGAAVSPDGKWMYYIVEDSERTAAALVLKRMSLADYRRKVIFTIKDKVPGTGFRPSRVYPLTTISSDGERLATSCFLGDGKTEKAPFGLLVFELRRPSVRVFPLGPDFNNMHPQYCRSRDPERSHDILIQHNHGSVVDASGKTVKLVGGDGADLHVMRDDGANWRDIPIGRDGREYVQGHQQWRGRMPSVSDTNAVDPVTKEKRITLVIGSLTGAGQPVLKLRYLLNTRTSGLDQPMHPHPFFSPDARMAFFNSDAAGKPQVWMVTRYQFPE